MSARGGGSIPIVEKYRGVGIHNGQPQERIERRVKPEIDAVLAAEDLAWLFAYCGNPINPPEARLLAGAKCEAAFEASVDERRERPRGMTLELVRARTAGLESETWRNPFAYGAFGDHNGGEPREIPLVDD